ncbi:hypothetical protein K488DRAFT_48012, partial [Vararia minispora EC-137]
TCAQGNVPLYAVNATMVKHIQAGVRFAARYDLRLAVKSSGHDYLGRSTAKNSLLIWVHYFQNITFTESFNIDGMNLGSAVTLGSGVGLHTIYTAAESVGKMVVGGSAATVALGGGYIQGGGHSALSPSFGLASDNALQFEVVLASGELITANRKSYPDLFWALRGGGGGSWGVVTSATIKTYPTFNATYYTVTAALPSVESVSSIMTSHARHIFDWGDIGHYYSISVTPLVLVFETLFPNTSAEDAIALTAPFWGEAISLGAVVLTNSTTTSLVNKLFSRLDDSVGIMQALGSRLIPAAAYHDIPDIVGKTHVRTGKVAENANISSAVTPKWRTAKNHFVTSVSWNESTTPEEVQALREALTTQLVPLLANATGETDSGAYFNEADVHEPDSQTTFFGGNYARLSQIKANYDPKDLFIVGAGVGSERWDEYGLCTV